VPQLPILTGPPPFSTKAMILCALAAGRTYGGDIAARLKGLDTIADGTLYPALEALREEGLIDVVKGEQRATGRRRRYFALTRAGRKVVRAYRALFAQLGAMTIEGEPLALPALPVEAAMPAPAAALPVVAEDSGAGPVEVENGRRWVELDG
jgi:PadR family transcriptional regulator, regulatory protein PadR